jgi:predicted DNA-binding transcriptional regulator AlpA
MVKTEIEPLCVPIPTGCALLSVSRASIYRRAKDEDGLELIKIGGRTMITMASIRRQAKVA